MLVAAQGLFRAMNCVQLSRRDAVTDSKRAGNRATSATIAQLQKQPVTDDRFCSSQDPGGFKTWAWRRPRLHCTIVELIDNFFAEYPATAASDKVDTAEADEVIDALAKTIPELTCQQDGLIRQQLIEQLMREIMKYDAEFRQEDAGGAIPSHARH